MGSKLKEKERKQGMYRPVYRQDEELSLEKKNYNFSMTFENKLIFLLYVNSDCGTYQVGGI